MLVEAGADIKVGDRNGKSAAVLASQRQFNEVAEYLSSLNKSPDGEGGGEGTESQAGEASASGPSAPSTGGGGAGVAGRRGSAQSSHLMGGYKGLVEKAAAEEKRRLASAAQLAEELVAKAESAELQACAHDQVPRPVPPSPRPPSPSYRPPPPPSRPLGARPSARSLASWPC